MFAEILTKNLRIFYENQFTGFIRVSGQNEKQWYLYFLLGRIVWAQSGFHDLRRWQRYVALHNPVFFEQVSQPVSLYYEYWNYSSVAKLVRGKQFPREIFSKIVEYYVTEILFDIIQTGTLAYSQTGSLLMEKESRNADKMPFIMLESLQSLHRAKQEWQRWEQVGLAKISPDWAPIIEKPNALKERIPLSTIQTLNSFANGEKTLRDISIESKQSIIPITRSILPYVSKQILSLTSLPDLVDNATHGFHLELTALEKKNTKEKEFDKEKSIQIDEQPVEPLETDSITIEAAVTAVPEAAVTEVAVTEVASAKIAASVTTSSRTSSPRTSSSAIALLEKGLPQTTSVNIEEPNIQLVASIKAKLDKSKLNSSLSKVKVPDSKALVSTVFQKEHTHGDPVAHKNKELSIAADQSGSQHLPKIVHIEDSLFHSRVMSPIVEGLGYRYINIQDPLQALPMLIEMKPELIFLDLVMPMANGFEVCGQIRRISIFKQTPIIIVTGNKGLMNRLRVTISGASGFMSKPIKEKKVKNILKRHIEKSR